jgi:hypothetical protein
MTEISQSTDPLSLELIKSHIVIEHNLDDTLLEHYKNASLDTIEKYLNASILERIFQSGTVTNESDVLTFDLTYKPKSIIVYYTDGSQDDTVDYFYDIGAQMLYVDNQDFNIDRVEAFITPININTSNQIRLLLLANWYAFREADTNLNLKEVPTGIMFIIDKIKGSEL